MPVLRENPGHRRGPIVNHRGIQHGFGGAFRPFVPIPEVPAQSRATGNRDELELFITNLVKIVRFKVDNDDQEDNHWLLW